MSSFPNHMVSTPPHVGFSDFNECSLFVVALEGADLHATHRQPVNRARPFLELAGRGKMPTTHSLIPCVLPFGKPTGGGMAFGVLVSNHVAPVDFRPAGFGATSANRILLRRDHLHFDATNNASLGNCPALRCSKDNTGTCPRAELSPIPLTKWRDVKRLCTMGAGDGWHRKTVAQVAGPITTFRREDRSRIEKDAGMFADLGPTLSAARSAP